MRTTGCSLAARLLALAGTVSALTGAPLLEARAVEPVRVETLDGQAVEPLRLPAGVTAAAYVFVSVECPVSNRYAPEVRRLHERFAAQGVRVVLVYPNPADTPAAIRTHLEAYGYPVEAWRDPRHALVAHAQITITPEVAVFTRAGALAYRGRIDDRYVTLGLERPAATTHDLADALTSVLAGAPVRQPRTQAVGCYVADFAR